MALDSGLFPVCHLHSPPWNSDFNFVKIAKAFQKEGCDLFIVGGSVRDTLQDKRIQDIDLGTSALPSDVKQIAKKSGISYLNHGEEHGVITLCIDHQKYDCATFRQDIETDGRAAKVSFTKSMKEDALRRDFTINALYADLSGAVYAPLADSWEDLTHGILRFIGSPELRLKEDTLRALRYCRFRLDYISPDESRIIPCLVHALKSGKKLSSERVFPEIQKIIHHPQWEVTIKFMLETGIIQVLFPKAQVQLIKKLVQSPPASLSWPTWLWILQVDKTPLTRALRKQVNHIEKAMQNLSHMPSAYQQWSYHHGHEFVLDIGKLYTLFYLNTPLPESWEKKSEAISHQHFPLTGDDIIQQTPLRGQDVGKALNKVLRWWIEQKGTPKKDDCLKYLTCNIL